MICVTLIALVSSEANGQVYVPMNFDDNTFYQAIHFGGSSGGCVGGQVNAFFQDQILGDTIINSMTYKKVYRVGAYYQCSVPWYGNGPIWGYNGAIRQDTSTQKVYYVFWGNSNEELIYDYTLTIGDTLKTPLYTGCPAIVITQIDSIVINNQVLRRWKTDMNSMGCIVDERVFIEGIGSIYGLVNQYHGFEMAFELMCINTDLGTLYPDSSTSCSYFTSINENAIINAIRIFPNPASDLINVWAEKSVANYRNEIDLYSSTGHLVFSKTYHSSQFTVPRNGLPSGLYFYRIIGGAGGIYTGKVLLE